MLARVSVLLRELRISGKHYKEGTFNGDLFVSWMRAIRDYNTMTHDDTLVLAVDLLQHEDILAIVRRNCEYIFIDEFQDFTPSQWAVVRTLQKDFGKVTAVGDDDQNIYEFRGALAYVNFEDFSSSWQEVKIRDLSVNFRSTPSIVAVARACVAKNRQRRQKSLTTPDETSLTDDDVHIAEFQNQYEESKAMANKIRGLLASGLKPKDIAVLYRSMKQKGGYRPARLLQVELQKMGIPFSVHGDDHILKPPPFVSSCDHASFFILRVIEDRYRNAIISAEALAKYTTDSSASPGSSIRATSLTPYDRSQLQQFVNRLRKCMVNMRGEVPKLFTEDHLGYLEIPKSWVDDSHNRSVMLAARYLLESNLESTPDAEAYLEDDSVFAQLESVFGLPSSRKRNPSSPITPMADSLQFVTVGWQKLVAPLLKRFLPSTRSGPLATQHMINESDAVLIEQWKRRYSAPKDAAFLPTAGGQSFAFRPTSPVGFGGSRAAAATMGENLVIRSIESPYVEYLAFLHYHEPEDQLVATEDGSSGSGSDGKVFIGTIHQAKALQWNTVFVPQFNEENFRRPVEIPSNSKTNADKAKRTPAFVDFDTYARRVDEDDEEDEEIWPVDSNLATDIERLSKANGIKDLANEIGESLQSTRKHLRENDDNEEESRLAHVAFTRPERSLYISYIREQRLPFATRKWHPSSIGGIVKGGLTQVIASRLCGPKASHPLLNGGKVQFKRVL
ncbi:hypothetical protein HK102_010491 [Quaeritorhiza haematococci]|nr:hypothetical protein HK102_010491 [Quaeritorhiza haematococci]